MADKEARQRAIERAATMVRSGNPQRAGEKKCPGCGEYHAWDEATVWGLLSVRCPKSPTGYWYFEVEVVSDVS